MGGCGIIPVFKSIRRKLWQHQKKETKGSNLPVEKGKRKIHLLHF